VSPFSDGLKNNSGIVPASRNSVLGNFTAYLQSSVDAGRFSRQVAILTSLMGESAMTSFAPEAATSFSNAGEDEGVEPGDRVFP